MGGAFGAPPVRKTSAWRVAVRVLRAGVDRGSSGSGDVPGAAAVSHSRDQGRYLGGRPPYGYRLADAGPHPNKAHAAWGRRARRLEPDPETAPVVRWMFAQRRAGHSLARITRALNDAGIPCPSAADPGRNPHRSGQAWTLFTVRAILANPRYTCRQVWNRQLPAVS